MLEIPFAIQWTIPEECLTPLKNSINGCLFSTTIVNIPEFEYYFGIFPNGDTNDRRKETWIFLYLKYENRLKIVTKWNISIESANYSFLLEYVFEKNTGWGKSAFCKTEDFFDPEKKFIVDGECTLKVNGIFKFENKSPANFEKQKWEGIEFGDRLWAKDESKDFKIIVDEKKVHKLILASQSDVFSAMFNPKMKESIEGKVEIPDFSFDVVETAIRMIYHCNFISTLSIDELMFLLQFFDKYDLLALKDKVEQILIMQISTSNACRLMNCSIFTNSTNLKLKCTEFLKASLTSNIALADIEILDNDIVMEIHQKSFYQIIEIDEC